MPGLVAQGDAYTRTSLAYERSELVRDESAARVASLATWSREGSPARILVASLQALFQRTLSPEDIPEAPLTLHTGARLDMAHVTTALVELGIRPGRKAPTSPRPWMAAAAFRSISSSFCLVCSSIF